MRLRLAWAEGLALFFLFAADSRVAGQLRWRLEEWLRFRTMPLHQIVGRGPERLVEDVLEQLLGGGRIQRAPLWLELLESPGLPAWDAARNNLLARMNERRAAIERQVNAPLLIVLPDAALTDVRTLAPDLWHVRVHSVQLAAAEVSPPEIEISPGIILPTITSDIRLEAAEPGIYADWRRLFALPDQRRINLEVGLQAFDEALERFDWQAASDFASQAEEIARGRVARSDSPQALRDLSVSLDKVGGIAEALGRLEEAKTLRAEAQQVRETLRVRYPEMAGSRS